MAGEEKKLSNQNVLHYVIAFGAVLLLVIVVMGAYLSHFYYEKTQEDFLKNNELYLSNVAKTHENELQILADIATQVELSEAARFLLTEQPTKSSSLKKLLYQYRSVNQFFDVMYCYYQAGEYLYNHITSMSVDYFCGTAYAPEQYTSEELREILCTARKTMLVLPEQRIDGDVQLFYSEQATSAIYLVPIAPAYDCILIFFVGESHFDSLLADEAQERRSRYLVYDGEIVAARSDAAFSQEELLAALEEASADAVTGTVLQKKAVLGGQSCVLTLLRESSGFTYVSVQEMSVFAGDLLAHAWGIAAILIVCCIPTFFMVWFLSKRMLGGVRQISRLLSEDEEDVYGLDHIQEGIRRLVVDSESMREDQLSLRKNRFLSGFVRSDYTALEILRRDAVQAGMDCTFGMHMVGITGSRTAEEEEAAFEQILRYLRTREGIDGHGIRLMNSNRHVLVLFGAAEEVLYDTYQEILQLGKRYSGEFVVAVSWFHRSLLNGSLAYLEANTAYDSRFLMDNNKIIRFTETGQNSSLTVYQDLRSRYMTQLENIIRVGNEKEVEQAIRDMCRKLEEEHATLLTFRLLYDEVLRLLMMYWKGEEKDWNQIYNVFTLSDCLTMEDFYSLLTEACHSLLDARSSAQDEQSELVAQAIRRMQQDYGKAELNMAFLAEVLGVSPAVLAVEFKNEMGISPSDYLAVIRLDRAKELLRTTDLLIKDISMAVGYEDDHVFIRRFKKYTGKTPGQYRKEAQG